MGTRTLLAFALVLMFGAMQAGDDASGPIHYSVDLGQPFTAYKLNQRDRAWADGLAAKLKYTGQVVHFVRTSIPLVVDEVVVEGAVYQAVEKPTFFYVVPGDAMLVVDSRWPFSPGVGGFSMHAPKSMNFIAALNLSGGVPFLSSTPVLSGKVTWGGHEYKRF